MFDVKQITKYVIKNSLKRIFLYRACLARLKMMGVEKVFSYTLANDTGVTPDQVRKDFSEFGIRGNKRGGYEISDLLEKMENIFHRNKDHNIVLIGMGNLGLALSKYSKFVQRNMNIVATFDIDPFKQKIRSDIPVYSMSRLKEIIDRFRIKVAILAVPEISAQQVSDELVRAGIKGIVNFAPVLLKVPPEVVINNVNLCDELESVIYYVHKLMQDEGLKNLEILYKDMKY
ncbi:MAG TPA: redox-sensing transcriptional repressor Rex [Bacteroidales bacterium]|nr:redox-sensing transcriptional repressor Rex [Bacteroidales bacterium]HBZ20397.1 redox-sensing transcriptional repressor Rex [Bacteroidales bacterium]